MAREFAQIKLSIARDDDWLDLSPEARYLYLSLLISETLTHCGVADWRPGRISGLNGQSVETIERAGAEMVASRHLVIDVDTEEVLIRSFIRNDGLMKQPKMASAMANAHRGVASRAIRGVVVHELQRLKEDLPDLPGWKSEKADHLLSLRALKASDYPLGGGPERDSEGGPFRGPVRGPLTPRLGKTQGNVKGYVEGSPTPAPAPTPYILTSVGDSSKIADAIPDQQRPDVIALCERLAKAIEANGLPKPKINNAWMTAARLLIDKDGFTVPQIEWMIDWATNDEFWRSNILSMPKLREKFPQLKLKAVPETAAKPKVDPDWHLR